jgi:hypothetical protein
MPSKLDQRCQAKGSLLDPIVAMLLIQPFSATRFWVKCSLAPPPTCCGTPDGVRVWTLIGGGFAAPDETLTYLGSYKTLVCARNGLDQELCFSFIITKMAASQDILRSTRVLNRQGNDISQTMVDFLNSVKTQPLGFRDLGLDFLSVCKIVGSLRGSLEEHFETNQPFPERAVPELMKLLTETADDFVKLQGLLKKFMDFEKGGVTGAMQKTWRRVFADKDVAKVRDSLQKNSGALRMTMLLTNMWVLR